MWIEQRIAVDAHQQLVPGQQRTNVQRRRLALVRGEMDDPQSRYLRGEPVEHFGGIVAAAVVDGDDLEFR
jgi:hypothetical protein